MPKNQEFPRKSPPWAAERRNRQPERGKGGRDPTKPTNCSSFLVGVVCCFFFCLGFPWIPPASSSLNSWIGFLFFLIFFLISLLGFAEESREPIRAGG